MGLEQFGDQVGLEQFVTPLIPFPLAEQVLSDPVLVEARMRPSRTGEICPLVKKVK